MSNEKTAGGFTGVEPVVSESENPGTPREYETVPKEKKPWYYAFAVWGSAPQIILAAMLALAIGLPVSMTVKNVPKQAPVYLNIIGDLWLRSLKAIGKNSQSRSRRKKKKENPEANHQQSSRSSSPP